MSPPAEVWGRPRQPALRTDQVTQHPQIARCHTSATSTGGGRSSVWFRRVASPLPAACFVHAPSSVSRLLSLSASVAVGPPHEPSLIWSPVALINILPLPWLPGRPLVRACIRSHVRQRVISPLVQLGSSCSCGAVAVQPRVASVSLSTGSSERGLAARSSLSANGDVRPAASYVSWPAFSRTL